MDRSAQPVGLMKSVVRVAEVFDFFRSAPRPARAVDVAEALSLPRSSTNELLKSLVQTGYLTFHGRDKTYFPSLRLATLGHWVSTHYYGRSSLLALMRHLSDETGAEAVTLVVQNEFELEYVAVEASVAPFGGRTAVGIRLPIVGSAAGEALLATKPDHEVISLVRSSRRSKPIRHKETPYSILEEIRETRARGYGVRYGSVLPGVGGIAVVLPQAGVDIPVILGVGGEADELRRRENDIVMLMRAAIPRYLV